MDEGAKSRHLEVRQQRRLEQQPPRPRAPCPEFGARGVQSGDDATGDTMQPAMRPGTQHQHDFSRRVAEKHQVGNAKRFTTKEHRCHAKNTGAMHLQLQSQYGTLFTSTLSAACGIHQPALRGIKIEESGIVGGTRCRAPWAACPSRPLQNCDPKP